MTLHLFLIVINKITENHIFKINLVDKSYLYI